LDEKGIKDRLEDGTRRHRAGVKPKSALCWHISTGMAEKTA
jgi:hypothetical protein